MYHSTLPKRDRPITANDFAVPEGSIRFTQRTRENARIHTEEWEKHIPLLPRHILRAFNGVTPSPIDVDMLSLGNGYFSIRLHDAAHEISDAYFNFDMINKEQVESSIHVDQKSQARGIGTRIANARLGLCAAFDFPSIEFRACQTNGGYSWARRGYEIDGSFNKSYLGETIRGRLISIEEHLPQEIFTACKVWSHLSNPDDITDISRQDYILPPDIVIDDYNTVDGLRRNKFTAAFVSSTNKMDRLNGIFNEISKLQSLFIKRDQEGKQLKLGQFLLWGSDWHSRLDLNCARQLKKIERLSGALTTMVWEPPSPASFPQRRVVPA